MRSALEVSTADRDEAMCDVVMISDVTTTHYRVALERLAELNRRHDAALADYETTPEGQARLTRAIGHLRESGDQDGVNKTEARLTVARVRRDAQIADQATSRAYADHLTHLTPEERVVLEKADDTVTASQLLALSAEEHVTGIMSTLTQRAPQYDKAVKNYALNQKLADDANAGIRTAAITLRSAAVRLFKEAGVRPGMAAVYANDMVEASQENEAYDQHGSRMSPTAELPVRPIVMKVKRRGSPDHDRTVAAKSAAQSDPEFKQASVALRDAITSRRTALHNRDSTDDDGGALADNAHILRVLQQAQMAMEDNRHAYVKAQEAAKFTYAHISAGIGMDNRNTSLHSVADDVVRNPDGSINAYSYETESPGFPNGRLRPVVAVTQAHADSTANALVLDNGRYLVATRGWSKTAGRDVTQSPSITITPPHEGSVPLRNEASSESGYLTYRRDTSD